MLRAEQKSFLHQKNMILKKFKAKKLQPNNMTKWSQPTKKLKKLDICLNGKFGILYHATFLRIGKFSSIMKKRSQPTKKIKKKLDIHLNGKFGILYHATFLRIEKFSSIMKKRSQPTKKNNKNLTFV